MFDTITIISIGGVAFITILAWTIFDKAKAWHKKWKLNKDLSKCSSKNSPTKSDSSKKDFLATD